MTRLGVDTYFKNSRVSTSRIKSSPEFKIFSQFFSYDDVKKAQQFNTFIKSNGKGKFANYVNPDEKIFHIILNFMQLSKADF